MRVCDARENAVIFKGRAREMGRVRSRHVGEKGGYGEFAI